MKITCITATAPGREKFLARCKEYVSRFTRQPDEHLVVSSTDFRANLRTMVESAQGDMLAFIEDDDWYHPEYLKDMHDRLEYSKRALIGYDPTMYYHILHEGYKIIPHKGRASLYTTAGFTNVIYTALDPILDDKNKAVDISLWSYLHAVSVTTVGHLAIGIKHGFTATTEGRGHQLPATYWSKDPGGLYLKSLIGESDFEFYRDLTECHRAGKF